MAERSDYVPPSRFGGGRPVAIVTRILSELILAQVAIGAVAVPLPVHDHSFGVGGNATTSSEGRP